MPAVEYGAGACGRPKAAPTENGSAGLYRWFIDQRSDLARSARRKEVKIWRASFSLGLRACAACGRKSKPGISAAVEKRKDQRKPAAFFGHRKVECKNRFSFHKRKEKWVLIRLLMLSEQVKKTHSPLKNNACHVGSL